MLVLHLRRGRRRGRWRRCGCALAPPQEVPEQPDDGDGEQGADGDAGDGAGGEAVVGAAAARHGGGGGGGCERGARRGCRRGRDSVRERQGRAPGSARGRRGGIGIGVHGDYRARIHRHGCPARDGGRAAGDVAENGRQRDLAGDDHGVAARVLRRRARGC